MLLGKEGRPDGSEQELDDRDFAQELDGLEHEHGDDPGGDQDRSGGTEEQRPLDRRFEERARTERHRYCDSRCSRLAMVTLPPSLPWNIDPVFLAV